MRPRTTEENFSKATKKNIKNKIDITKMGVGITKLRKATNEAILLGCQNTIQANKLKENVVKDLGYKYVVQKLKKKKLKIKIFDVKKEN